MSSDCQIMGCNECTIGKECTNNNCDYRICDRCALNILKNTNYNIYNKFNCPACQRPILFNFDKRILFFYYYVYFKNYIKKFFFNHICPFFGVSSIIWTCLCIGRVFLILLNHFRFMKGMTNDFFDEFLIRSIMGWIILCFLGIVLFIIISVIISFFSFIYFIFQIIKNIYNNEFIEIDQNP